MIDTESKNGGISSLNIYLFIIFTNNKLTIQ